MSTEFMENDMPIENDEINFSESLADAVVAASPCDCFVGVVAAKHLNLRSAASMKSAVKCVLDKGTELYKGEHFDKNAEMVNVKTAFAEEGYVASEFVEWVN